MKMSISRVLAAACVIGLGAFGASARPGPDVIVGDLYGIQNWGALGSIRAYSIATESCNIGNQNLLWIASNNQHPVIAQNMYRLLNGRFEQVGQSWLKHGFTALTLSLCGTCNGQGGSVLGVGCSDPYSTSLNGSQTRLGPRFEVNATTGFYPYPYTIAWQQTGNVIFKRLQVEQSDLANPGALYFIEGHYITADDAASGNGLNNASYRRITINETSFNGTLQGTTQREKPAIQAWKDHGLGVGMPDPGVMIAPVDYTEQGQTARFWVASKATDLGGGMWQYEYAVQNLNSHRSGGSFVVPLAPGSDASELGFHGVPYHSGEPWLNTPWLMVDNPSDATFLSPHDFQTNPNTNALRWGTLYNFRFKANTAPTTGNVTIGLFRPGLAGEPNSVSVSMFVPSASTVSCYPDCNGDALLNLADFGCFQTKFATQNMYADCNGDSILNLADFGCFQTKFAIGCP